MLCEPISPAERLPLTIRFLASGSSQTSMSFTYRVGRTTVSNIIRETCCALWEALLRNISKHFVHMMHGRTYQKNSRNCGTLCNCHQYADDTTIYNSVKPKDFQLGVEQMNNSLTNLTRWSDESKLALNNNKTKA
ncbi:Hypothetical predicted protein, partial [Paramuricea clavata]